MFLAVLTFADFSRCVRVVFDWWRFLLLREGSWCFVCWSPGACCSSARLAGVFSTAAVANNLCSLLSSYVTYLSVDYSSICQSPSDHSILIPLNVLLLLLCCYLAMWSCYYSLSVMSVHISIISIDTGLYHSCPYVSAWQVSSIFLWVFLL